MRTLRLTLVGTVIFTLAGGSVGLVAAQEDSPSRQTNSDILPGVALTVQEIEPDVFRVLSDGVRDLAWPVESETVGPTEPPGRGYWWEAGQTHIVADDERVWFGRPEGIMRLGEDGLVWSAPKRKAHLAARFEAAPDGTLYVSRDPAATLSEDGWQKVSRPRVRGFDFPPSGFKGSIHFGPDGSMWVRGDTDKNTKKEREAFARRDADGWTLVKVPLPRPKLRSWPVIDEVAPTDDGVIVRRENKYLQRYDGTRWTTLQPDVRMRGLFVGDDGSVWVQSYAEGWDELLFHRLPADGASWTTHALGPGHPHDDYWSGRKAATTAAAPDGALWFTPSDGAKMDGRCDGIARYDGIAETRFLRGLCVHDIAFGPDGGIWVLAGDWTGSIWDPDEVGPVEPYVITAQAVTPAE